MKHFRLLLAVLLLGLAAPACAPAFAKTWTTVTIATEGSYPPYNFHGPDGTLQGFEIDLAADLCKRAKLTCTFVPQDWDGIIPALQAGKFDAIMSGMSVTPKRLEVIDFSLPYASSPTTFATGKDSGLENLPLTGTRVPLGDEAAAKAAMAELVPKLKGKAIGVQVSTIQSDLLANYLKGVADVRLYKTNDEIGLDLAAGRVDLMLASTSNLRAYMDAPDGKDLVFTGPLLTGGPLGQGAGIGLRKSDSDLKALFDAAITDAKADGTIGKLSLKWFKVDITPQ